MRSTAAGLVLLLLTAAGCAHSVAPQPPPPPVSESVNGTDTAWLQLMIPMTEQLLAILDLVPARGGNPAIASLATTTGAGHRTELAQLRQSRDEAGLPAGNVHSGHTMPGMITDQDLTALRTLTGPEFDTRLLAVMRANLDQSALLCDGEARSGTNPSLRTLAATMEGARADERTRLDALTSGG